MAGREASSSGGSEMPECPSCLQWGVRTPVERHLNTPMKYCTFHYWLMKGREGFLLDAYVEHSRYFHFTVSLPSLANMARMNLAPELGMPELGSLLTLSEKLSVQEERLLLPPLRSAPSGPGRTSGPALVSSQESRSEAWAMSAQRNPQPICVPA